VVAAGALGLAGTTALDALAAGAPQPGETVLISATTGTVGAIASQYATAAGARVMATARRPGTETDFVRGLGATDVVDMWIVQAVLTAAFVIAGVQKSTQPKEKLRPRSARFKLSSGRIRCCMSRS
jgi:NADPH:quinone reductase-like Zn-dependent oxidoreductase